MKVLIIRFSSIGDIVLTTPVIRGLKQQLGAEVHYLTKPGYASILTSNPHVDKVHTLPEQFSELKKALRHEQFDYVIDLHKNLRSRRVRLALSGRHRAFDKINWEKWLMVNLKWDHLPDKHIVHRYMETVRTMGVEYDGKGLDYFIPEEDEVVMSNFLSTNVLQQSDVTPDYVALVIGAAHATKRLPEQKIIELCRQIQLPVVLLGGPAESEQGRAIADAAGGHVLNTCGMFNLHQSASVVKQAQKVITHDTGLMHIAAAFSKPILSIWGNTIPEFGMYPFFPDGLDNNTTFEVEGLSCRPCSKIGYAECPKKHFRCMEQQALEKIAVAAGGGAPIDE
jgi:ADP-heptose:LPS heptosyltransferase